MQIKIINLMYLFDGYSLFRRYRENDISHYEELGHYGNWHDITSYAYLIEGEWRETPEQAIAAKQESIRLTIEQTKKALERYNENENEEKNNGQHK